MNKSGTIKNFSYCELIVQLVAFERPPHLNAATAALAENWDSGGVVRCSRAHHAGTGIFVSGERGTDRRQERQDVYGFVLNRMGQPRLHNGNQIWK